jgi:hypothetical protein
MMATQRRSAGVVVVVVGSVVDVDVVVVSPSSVVDVVDEVDEVEDVEDVELLEVDDEVVVGGAGHADASDAPAGVATLLTMTAKPRARAAPRADAWNFRLRTMWDAR